MHNIITKYVALASLLNACGHSAARSPSTISWEKIDDVTDKIDEGEISYRPQGTRHLLESNTECVLYLKGVQYEDGRQEDSWSCEFSPNLARQFGGVGIMDIEGLSKEELDSRGAISGEAVLRVGTSAFVEQPRQGYDGKFVLHVPQASNYAVHYMESNIFIRHPRNQRGLLRHWRKLESSLDEPLDTLKVLVVRVIDSVGTGPDPDAAQLEEDIFDGNVCLKSQFEACNHNQVLIEQATEFSTILNNNVTVNGIVNVEVDVLAEEGNVNVLEHRAIEVAENTYGPLAETYDLVMFCLPPGTGDWLAYAYINDWRSFYNNKWCQRVSAQMHEIGHNLNLGHSGLPNDSEYADKSGMMGFSYNVDNGPIQCFNPAKSFQLGWYTKQILSINPLDYIGEPQTFILNGVADYQKDGSNGDALVSLRLELEGLEGGVDYYVGYNRQVGCNIGTEQVPNLVTITEKENKITNFDNRLFEGRNGYGLTRRISALGEGQSLTLADYSGTTSDVTLTVNYIRGMNASITVVTSEPEPTQAPTICESGKLQIELFTDSFGRDTRWSIQDSETMAIIAQSSGEYRQNTAYVLPSPTSSYCLTPGECYIFTITDRQGDGMCCDFGMGYFRINLDGTLIYEGGDFQDKDVVEFCVPYESHDTLHPSVSPTDPPTRVPTIESTAAPTASISPTEECVDDPDFRFKNSDKKDCDWVKDKRKNKRKRTCKKDNDDGVRVADSCRKTCGKIGVGPCKKLEKKNKNKRKT